MRKQILLEFECDGYINSHVCLVIPYLSSEVILGNDWNLKNGVIINYNNRTIQIKDKQISSSVVLFERSISDKLFTSQDDEMTYIYVIKMEGANNELVVNSNDKRNANQNIQVNKIFNNEETDEDEKEILYGNTKQKKDDIEEITINIKEINVNNEQLKVNENKRESNLSEELRSIAVKLTTLTTEQRKCTINLLEQNFKLFVEKPGGAWGFEYSIKLKISNPNINRSYSIPLH